MKCRRVEKLLPLFVEGDLASGIADRLASHLDWCGRCNWLADEYKESQSWLRANQPPEFDSAFLDSFKAGVLRRVEESAGRPSLLASLVQQWSRRQVLALSAALLIIFGALVFYIYHVRIRVNQEVHEAVEQAPNKSTAPSNKPELEPATGRVPGAGSEMRHHFSKLTAAKTRDRGLIVMKQPVESPLVSQTARAEQSGSTAATPVGVSDDPPGMLRIEIETGDPNIRIIWFAPKEIETP